MFDSRRVHFICIIVMCLVLIRILCPHSPNITVSLLCTTQCIKMFTFTHVRFCGAIASPWFQQNIVVFGHDIVHKNVQLYMQDLWCNSSMLDFNVRRLRVPFTSCSFNIYVDLGFILPYYASFQYKSYNSQLQINGVVTLARGYDMVHENVQDPLCILLWIEKAVFSIHDAPMLILCNGQATCHQF